VDMPGREQANVVENELWCPVWTAHAVQTEHHIRLTQVFFNRFGGQKHTFEKIPEPVRAEPDFLIA